jgi:hypothetical protein
MLDACSFIPKQPLLERTNPPLSAMQKETPPVTLTLNATGDEQFNALIDNTISLNSCIKNKDTLVQWINHI